MGDETRRLNSEGVCGIQGEMLYLYGVVAPATISHLGRVGIGGADVYALGCGQIDALVSWLPPAAVDFSTEAVMAHEQVLVQALPAGAILPAAFGHLFATEAELSEHLEPAAVPMREKLTYLQGRIEVGVKAIWRKDTFLDDIATPELHELVEQARASERDPSLTMQVGELVEDLVGRRRSQYVAQICPQLEAIALEMNLSDPLTPRMIFNAAFLIEADAYDGFAQRVNQIAAPYAERLDFQFSGPWPPHNFARLNVGPAP